MQANTGKILLISETEIKNQSIIEQNVDSKTLGRIIMNVQETQLKAILGEALYLSVLNSVFELSVNATPLTTDTLELLETYIVPFVTYATMSDFIVINNYKISSKGTLKLNDNQGTSINSAEIEYAKNYYDNYTTTYKNNLIKYLGDKSLDVAGSDRNVTAAGIGWYLEKDCTCSPEGEIALGETGFIIEEDSDFFLLED